MEQTPSPAFARTAGEPRPFGQWSLCNWGSTSITRDVMGIIATLMANTITALPGTVLLAVLSFPDGLNA